jgi:hypothetical protein
MGKASPFSASVEKDRRESSHTISRKTKRQRILLPSRNAAEENHGLK